MPYPVRHTKPHRHDAATAAIWLNAGRCARSIDASSTAMPAPPRITHAVLAIQPAAYGSAIQPM